MGMSKQGKLRVYVVDVILSLLMQFLLLLSFVTVSITVIDIIIFIIHFSLLPHHHIIIVYSTVTIITTTTTIAACTIKLTHLQLINALSWCHSGQYAQCMGGAVQIPG